ncbi:NACHT domain-containing protein [Acetobacter tropicalis]|uniref:NACHT domain-containing protein n=1 Tax=Acetobacter tropicalis TaxID=104102 RepID=A0A252A0B3_9PROT|nr:NACHT domain-containing protein [Acetobacter tropicalis]OUI80518.1 hypothetical protein HC62_17035 [Acetobacter tropicalis]
MKRSPQDEKQFEIDVRNIARQLWNPKGYSGAVTIDGQERDGIFETDEVVHYIEITTSKSAKKAREDIEKIKKFLPTLAQKYPGKIAKGWWITLFEPTGEQGAYIASAPTNIFHCNYIQFLSKLIDSSEYINLRNKKYFGSARNIADDSTYIPSDEYVPCFLIDSNSNERFYYSKFRDGFIKNPKKCLITGEFGVGKSMFARQLFFDLSLEHKAGRDLAFPVYINLREHAEQKDPDECLTRHAKSIGYPKPYQLIKAWLAGYVNLILDGFDELPPILATRETGRAKEIRKSAMELVRRFISECPQNSGLIVLGRSNFFDSYEDTLSTLHIKKDWNILSIPDFTDAQVAQYLTKKGIKNGIPSWLPRRPLLIGYMIGKNLLLDAEDYNDLDRVSGWKRLIRLVCEREVEQVNLALDVDEMVRIYARIGTKSRSKVDPLGPISLVDCRDAFSEITNVIPEGRALSALLRLPGLVGIDNQKADDASATHIMPGARWFVDETFQAAVSAEDVVLSISDVHNFNHNVFMGMRHYMRDFGLELISSKINESGKGSGFLCSAFSYISQKNNTNPVLIDYVNSIISLNDKSSLPDGIVKELFIPELTFFDSNVDFSGVHFNNCYFENIVISETNIKKLPKFNSCLIEKLETHHKDESFIETVFPACQIEKIEPTYVGYDEYRHYSENNKMLALTSVLDKIFIQSKTGRLDTALKRGITQDQSSYIDRIVEILRKEGYINKVRRRGEIIWVPDIAYTSQVRSILRDPDASTADIVVATQALE